MAQFRRGSTPTNVFTVTFDLTVQEGSKDIGAARISGAFMPYPSGEYPYTADQIELSEQEGSTDLKAELAAYQGYAYFADVVIEDTDGAAMEIVSDPTLSGGARRPRKVFMSLPVTEPSAAW